MFSILTDIKYLSLTLYLRKYLQNIKLDCLIKLPHNEWKELA